MGMNSLGKQILNLIHECQYCCTVARLDYSNSTWNSVSSIVGSLSGLLPMVQEQLGPEIAMEVATELKDFLPYLLSAQEKRDVNCIADIIENDVMYLLRRLAVTMEPDPGKLICAGNVSFEYNDVGEIVLIKKDEKGDILLTGRSHPFLDALQFFFEMRKDVHTYYALAGGCMIYEALAIMRAQIETRVYIVEENAELVNTLTNLFNLREYIDSGRITFVSENILKEIGRFMNEQALLVKPTSIICTDSDSLKYAYKKYRMILVSHKEESYLLYKNFEENCDIRDWKYVTSIIDRFEKKRVFLVAGGPSLGKCYDLLRNRDKEKSVILCAGTSAGKLIKEHINPEFVIITDALPTMKKQLDQPFDYSITSLIYLCSAHGGAVKNFEGPKYVAFQKDFDLAESQADKNGLPTYNTGGSVSTLALDILLSSKTSEIVCLGLDLAYTGKRMHADGVDDSNHVEKNADMENVRSVSGDVVSTAQNLNSYRKWIEKRLESYHGDIRIINYSDGAYIEGMENIPTDRELVV